MAASSALAQVGQPKIPRAALQPANSAMIEPTLATSIVLIMKVAHRTPYRSRTSPARPWPVASPSRAPTS